MPGSYLTLVLMLLALGVVIAGVVVITLAFALLHPPRMTDGKAIWVFRRLSPGDLGLNFEDVRFAVRDEQTGQPLHIAGWWIGRAGSCRCVLLLHGFADAKVGAIAWAPLWYSLGFNILAIDLRAHGESGGDSSTAGFWERHDVSQVVDQLRAQRPSAATEMVLFGVHLGAATAIAVAAMRDDLTAVVVENLPADFRSAAAAHMDSLGGPGKTLQSLALSLAQRMAGFNFSAVRPVDLVKGIACPVMIIAPDTARLSGDGVGAGMEQALRSRQRPEDVYWSVRSGNLPAIYAEPAAYEQKLGDFLRAVEQGPPRS